MTKNLNRKKWPSDQTDFTKLSLFHVSSQFLLQIPPVEHTDLLTVHSLLWHNNTASRCSGCSFMPNGDHLLASCYIFFFFVCFLQSWAQHVVLKYKCTVPVESYQAELTHSGV